jgi:hypothetical protein
MKKKFNVKEIWEKIKANRRLLDSCNEPHDFDLDSTGTFIPRHVRCNKCKGELDKTQAHWYIKGLNMSINDEMNKTRFMHGMSEVAKWKWILENKDRVKILLDNDDTQLFIDGEYVENGLMEYLGHSDGVYTLLTALGIDCDGV